MTEVSLSCTYAGSIKNHTVDVVYRSDDSLMLLERARDDAEDFRWRELIIPDSSSAAKLEQAIRAAYGTKSLDGFLLSCNGSKLILPGIVELCDAEQIAHTSRESQQNSAAAAQPSTIDIYRAYEHVPNNVATRMAEILGKDPEFSESDSDGSDKDDCSDDDYQEGDLLACIILESDLGIEVRGWIYQESDGIADNLEVDLVIVQEDMPAFRQALKEEYPEAEDLSDIIDMANDGIDFLMDFCDRNDVSHAYSLDSLGEL